ncbi:hypothetical protein ACFQ14_10570 [Pseudahrensia aquimaris]|uniref:Uncharacterized protein n=1 Tax=Pseudahrensia aquimaris TaxID=744461 RepID=A0ABW3FIW4_9HYPH
MSDEVDDGSLLTAIFFFSIIFFMASLPLISNYSGEKRYSEYAEICSADGEKRLALVEALPGYKGSTKKKDYKKNEPDWCDLAAQESVAYFTWWTAISAWAVTGLTLIGVIYLAKTLRATRETLSQAAKASNAANRTNDIMRDEQRPWLVIESKLHGFLQATEVNVLDYDLKVEWGMRVDVANKGKSGAFHYSIHTKIMCLDNWFNARTHVSEFVENCGSGRRVRKTGIVFPNEKGGLRPLKRSEFVAKESPNSKYFAVFVAVKYTDASGKLSGIDVQTFFQQQTGPSIGPWMQEFRQDPDMRVTK